MQVWPRGSVALFIAVSSFYVLVSLALGLIISATSATAAEAVQKSVLFSIPLVQLFSAASAASISGELDQVRSYATAIGINKADVTPALIDASHTRCLKVHPYVVDDTDEMLSMLEMGVDGIFTNRPDRLGSAIGQANQRKVGESGCTAVAH